MTTKIYALCEPDGKIRYIGKTSHSLSRRFSEHLSEARSPKGSNSYRRNWIRSLLNKQESPLIVLIGEVDGDGKEPEKAWISYGRVECWGLVNLTDGGDGTVGYHHTEEQKRKNGLRHLGIIPSEATRERISKALLGKLVSESTKKKLSIAQTGMQYSDVAKKRMSESHKGKLASLETKIRMSESQKGRHHTEKTKQKLAEINRGKHRSEETRTKLSLWHTGRLLSEATKRKMSESQFKRQNILRELKLKKEITT